MAVRIPSRDPSLATQPASTSAVGRKRCVPRWRQPFSDRPARQVVCREIAAVEKINETYVGRVLGLTLLAPDIVEAILGGRQSA